MFVAPGMTSERDAMVAAMGAGFVMSMLPVTIHSLSVKPVLSTVTVNSEVPSSPANRYHTSGTTDLVMSHSQVLVRLVAAFLLTSISQQVMVTDALALCFVWTMVAVLLWVPSSSSQEKVRV